ncbi:hypothetical protein P43SY_004381 [Pythium insidiosum]|uniref:Nucleoside phosphorylase domain-containing protein n=1 Tax=Pythium insidiosum TaxID=114742 RepID=A0AAD5LSN9_PYTIN|nr:hypothetical protein P43SY_004381 [Pythium insidiosum]
MASFHHVSNPNLLELNGDVMYHLGLTHSAEEPEKLAKLFGDVKFFVTGGSADRITKFASTVAKELGIETPFGYTISTIGTTARYVIYKVGPVLLANHGMGQPSVSILLHEVTKLLDYAGVKNTVYIRIGTSGGVGVEPGTVVFSSAGVNHQFESVHEFNVLDRIVKRPSICTPEVYEGLSEAAKQLGFAHTVGKTLTADDFYEGQGRLDGAICEYTKEDKMKFLHAASEAGVRNIEMEVRLFAAFCHRLNIPVACACVALLNRLHGDQVLSSHETLKGYEERPAAIVLQFIKNKLAQA